MASSNTFCIVCGRRFPKGEHCPDREQSEHRYMALVGLFREEKQGEDIPGDGLQTGEVG